MISVRLSKDDEKKLYEISENENITKSDIIKDALEKYFTEYDRKASPYEIGKNLFGKNGSNDLNSSTTYKQKVRQKIDKKMSD